MKAAQKPARLGGKNRHKHSPIPWLALNIAMFNQHCDSKAALAAARAQIADRIYAISQPIRKAHR